MCFAPNRYIRAQDNGKIFSRRDNVALIMGRESPSQIIRRADVDVAVFQFEEIDVPHAGSRSPCAPAELRETPYALRSVASHPKREARRVADRASAINPFAVVWRRLSVPLAG